MNVEKKVPEIRFDGFSGEWELNKLGQVYSFNYGVFNNNPSNGGQYPVYGANGIIGGYTSYNAESSAVIGHMGEYAGSVLWAEGKHFVTYNGTIAKPKISDFSPLFGYFKLVKMNLKKICGGSGQPFLSYGALERLDIVFPTEKEQTQIGNYFQKLDSLINQHQQKHDQLSNIKKAMLEKMFPKPGETIPEIRFKGFGGEWESLALGENARFTKGQGYSKSDLSESGIPIILYGRLYTKYQTVISQIDTFVKEKSKSLKSIGKEVIVPASGESSEDIARGSAVCESGVILGGDLNVIYPNDKINPVFLALMISNGCPHKELVSKAQGKSVVHIRNSDLESLLLAVPDKKEQTAIGNYFQKLDALINQHQQQITKLTHIKQACLSKMFV